MTPASCAIGPRSSPPSTTRAGRANWWRKPARWPMILAFEPAEAERPAVVDMAYWTGNPTSPASVRLSKALKTRGWTFVGPTTMYAFMQAMGMVNDHLEGCACRPQIEQLRRQFKRP